MVPPLVRGSVSVVWERNSHVRARGTAVGMHPGDLRFPSEWRVLRPWKCFSQRHLLKAEDWDWVVTQGGLHAAGFLPLAKPPGPADFSASEMASLPVQPPRGVKGGVGLAYSKGSEWKSHDFL